MNKDLRFQDEIVRHKILDVIGDLALLGKPVKGHIIAVRSGHAFNIRFVQKIIKTLNGLLSKESSKEPVKEPSKEEEKPFTPTIKYTMPITGPEIRKILPHRYPFLLIDKVIEMDYEKKTNCGD